MAEEQGGQKKGALDSLKNTGGDLGKKAWQIAGMFPGGQGWCCVAGCGCFALIIVILIIMIAMSLMATGMGEETAINEGEFAADDCSSNCELKSTLDLSKANKKQISMTVTAYYSPQRGQKKYTKGSYEAEIRMEGKGVSTATGDTPVPGTIAADPRYYPFGTPMSVPGYGYGVVNDVGGAIKGNHIDVWVGCGDKGREKAEAWGAKRLVVNVYVFSQLQKGNNERIKRNNHKYYKIECHGIELPTNAIAGYICPLYPPGIRVSTYSSGGKLHGGLGKRAADLNKGVNDFGEKIRAVKSGEIIFVYDQCPNGVYNCPSRVRNAPNRGNGIRIKQDDGQITYYGHIKKGSAREFGIYHKKRVVTGQVIARVDDSGHSSGDHLHIDFSNRYDVLELMKKLCK